MKVLNLYCGIGGNAWLWPKSWSVTAVDNNPDIVNQYKFNFPHHKVVQGDAHEYLRVNFSDYDLIWTSPPCPTHSRMAIATRHKNKKFPDMTLYEEIIFLQYHFKGKFVVENVEPFYQPLIEPSCKIGRHIFWTNLEVNPLNDAPSYRNGNKTMINSNNAEGRARMLNWLGMPPMLKNIYLPNSNDPAKPIRNAVHPVIGKHIVKELIE